MRKKEYREKGVWMLADILLNASYTNTEELSKTLTKEKTPSGISANFRIIWENRKTESNVNKCINIDTFIQSCPIMFVLYNETHRHTCE